jgi:hypothetical protein
MIHSQQAHQLFGTSLFTPKNSTVTEYDHLNNTDVMEHIGHLVSTGIDYTTANTETPLRQLIENVCQQDLTLLTDEEIITQLGFIKTGLRSHYDTLGRVVGPGVGGYHDVIQISEMLEWVEKVCGKESMLTAQLLEDGRKVAIVAKVTGTVFPTMPGVDMGYLCFSDSRDRSLTANIFPVAYYRRSGVFVAPQDSLMKKRHTRSIVARGNARVDEIIESYASFEGLAERFRAQLGVECGFESFLNGAFPVVDGKGASRRDRKRSLLRKAYGEVDEVYQGSVAGCVMAVDVFQQSYSEVRSDRVDAGFGSLYRQASGKMLSSDARVVASNFLREKGLI